MRPRVDPELADAISDIFLYGATREDVEGWVEDGDHAHLAALRII